MWQDEAATSRNDDRMLAFLLNGWAAELVWEWGKRSVCQDGSRLRKTSNIRVRLVDLF